MENEIRQMEIAKVSSKGQLVIPRSIRERLRVKEGSMFAVASCDNTLVLKKIESPIGEEDIKTMRIVDEAWDDIEKGKYKIASMKEFIEQAKRW